MTPSLRALMREAEERFPALMGHGERTASFAVAAGDRLGIAPARLSSLRIAAALHFAWSPTTKSCPCVEPDLRHLVRFDLVEAQQAADFIRSQFAEWRMAPVEASVLRAACEHDLRNIQVDMQPRDFRPGVPESLEAIKDLVLPLDYVS